MKGNRTIRLSLAKNKTLVGFLLRPWTTFFSAVCGLSLLMVTLFYSLDVVHSAEDYMPTECCISSSCEMGSIE